MHEDSDRITEGGQRGADARRKRRGMTLLEVTIAIVVLVAGAGAAAYALVSVAVDARAAKERQIALAAAENVVEALQGTEFAEVFARYNATAADDPAGLSPGRSFAVDELTARPGDADGQAGEVAFPGNGVELREDVDDPELGMPRDLGGAAGVDAADHALDYRVLPAVVRVRWRGVRGNAEVAVALTLSNDKNEP